MAIERAALVAALADVEPADQACRAALEEGATFELSNLTTSTAELVTIYDRRVRHLREKKILSVGADTVVARLRAVPHAKVQLGGVHSDTFNFVLFLDSGELAVLACIGVAASAANQDFDRSTLTS